MRQGPLIVFTTLGLFFSQTSPGALAQEAQPNSPVEFIIQKVIQNISENEMAKKALTYKRVHTIENLDNNEQTTDTEKHEITLIEVGGKETIIWLNGKSMKRRQDTPPDFDMLKSLRAMYKLDQFQILSMEMCDDRPCYVISFEARPGVTGSNKEEDVIVRSEGKMYVDIEKFYIKKLSARLIREYERCWGCFKLLRTDFTIEQEEFEEIIVMKSITIIDRFYALKNRFTHPGGMTFERKTYIYEDYRRP